MKKFSVKSKILLFTAFTALVVVVLFYPDSNFSSVFTASFEKPESQKLSRVEKKAARGEYFFNLMRDPATNRIPPNIRNRELKFAKTLPSALQVKQQAKAKNAALQLQDHTWQLAGPTDLGGRTRALAVDQRNPDIILAGGVSGGMWKSTDGGTNWTLTTPNLANLSVTSVAQDPSNPEVWYYVSGEFIGNSASANYFASYYGTGIYRSTDNGYSWSLVPTTSIGDETRFDSRFDFMSRVRIHPNGTVYVSSNGFGLLRSTDGENFDLILGDVGYHAYADVAISNDDPNTKIAAVLSSAHALGEDENPNNNPGIFISEDGGQSWNQLVLPDEFPDSYGRSVLSFAPSNSNILYILTQRLDENNTQDASFFKFDLETGEAFDRSENLPDFRDDNGNGSGFMNLQGGYNMEVAVHPNDENNDENIVFVGGTNLFRSTDGFATAPSGGYDGDNQTQKNAYWIGGYINNDNDNPFALYPGQHPDQHRVIFPDPDGDPNRVIAGHDGGLSITEDITASPVTWESLNNEYITTQFYTAAITEIPDDDRLLGGTQDNGSPYFRANNGDAETLDLSSGDGSYAYWGSDYAYVSSQNGTILRIQIDSNGNLTSPFDGSTSTDWAIVHPSGATDQIFIHPYVLDPNDESVMYYPSGSLLWRNTRVTEITNTDSDGTTEGWEQVQVLEGEYTISALELSQMPADILYIGASSGSANPRMLRLENAKTSSEFEEIPLPEGYDLAGAYVKDIAVNPVNGNEVIVVLSNYNITGLFHTIDGGQTWEAIEGNLTGTDTDPGPSLRTAAIIPAEGGTQYFVGSSTGLYFTADLDGDNTNWGQEAQPAFGNAVVDHLDLRLADGDLAIATHGRGMYLGDFQGNTIAPTINVEPGEGRPGDIVMLTADEFEFSSNPSDNIVTFGDERAQVVNASASQLEVEVPRDAIDRDASNNRVNLTVRTEEASVFALFNILPPNEFAISQNYPNPFDVATSIPFDLPDDSRVTVQVYNMYGQKVREPIYQDDYNAGSYDAPVDFSGLASGVYIYRVVAETPNGETHMDSRKMTFIK